MLKCGMCNTYRISPKAGDKRAYVMRVNDVASGITRKLVRKTDAAPVIRADGAVTMMRWGGHRSFQTAINNARCERLASGMWSEAYRERRCLIPMSSYYEWSGDGRKQAYEICNLGDDWLWAAGLWEENAQHGLCYSMITTNATAAVCHIHDRMPALLTPEETERWLSGESEWSFTPFTGQLIATPCQSPLRQPPGNIPSQPELF